MHKASALKGKGGKKGKEKDPPESMPTMKRPMMSISNDPAFSPRAINRAEITANTLLASRVPFLQGEREREREAGIETGTTRMNERKCIC